MTRPVTCGVEHIATAWERDLAHPDAPLREAAWIAFRADLRRFLDDVNLYAAVGLRELLHHAFVEANASLCAGHDGGPWLPFLRGYGQDVAAADALAEAEAVVGEIRE